MRRENSFVSINEVAIKTRWFCSSSFGCESILILGNGCECTIKKPTDCVFGLFGILICEPVFSSRLLFRCFFVIIINSESNSSTNWDHFGWSDKSANIAWAWWHRAMQSHTERKRKTHTHNTHILRKNPKIEHFLRRKLTVSSLDCFCGLLFVIAMMGRRKGKIDKRKRAQKNIRNKGRLSKVDNKGEPLQPIQLNKKENETGASLPLPSIFQFENDIRKNNFKMRIESMFSLSVSHEWMCFWFYFVFFLLLLVHSSSIWAAPAEYWM